MSDTQHNILVVDDLADWRKTLKGVLVDEGYTVEVADSLSGALNLLRTGRFDLAVVDVRLDDSDEENTDGLNLASEINQHWPAVKVVMITGYSTPEIMRQALAPNDQGQKLAVDYILKTKTEDLVKIVRKTLAQ